MTYNSQITTKSAPRRSLALVAAVIGATRLPCMIYNNPVAYRTDFLPAQVAELGGALSGVCVRARAGRRTLHDWTGRS